MANRVKTPSLINRSFGNIGAPPRGSQAESIRANSVYLRQQIGHGQIYTYSGPGPGTLDNYNPDYDYHEKNGVHSEFPIILHSAPKADSSDPARQLAGVLIPWRTVPGFFESEYSDAPAKISWKHLYDGQTVFRQLYRSDNVWPTNWADITRLTRINTSGAIQLFNSSIGPHFVDYNCECTGTDGLWVAGNSATISKDPVYNYRGYNSIRVARNGDNNPYVEGPYSNYTKQMTVGAKYNLSVWALSDGNAVPTVICGGDTLATGTTSTEWHQLQVSEFVADADVLKFQATTSTGTEHCWFAIFNLQEVSYFKYQPDASGEFTAGIMRVERIKVAALSVFTAPDFVLSDAQAVVTSGNVAEGRAIRGYTGSGVGSIGDLLYMAGAGGASYANDDCERNTRRCLLQSGHPMGLSTDQSSGYYQIRSDEASKFRIIPRNLTGKTSGNVSTIPMLYGYCQGASGGNPGYVKYTSTTSADTWTYEITSDTPGLWGDMTTLDVNATGDTMLIEFQAPSNGWLVCKTYSLWEDSFDS